MGADAGPGAGRALDRERPAERLDPIHIAMLESGVRTRVAVGTMRDAVDVVMSPDRWVGTIIEIRHHGMGDTGVPRHPVFSRRSDDL